MAERERQEDGADKYMRPFVLGLQMVSL